MTQRDPGVYLEDIEYHADAAVRFVSGYSLEQYLADEKIAPAIAESIPHSHAIIGFRNILAHGYAEIDHNKVYDIAVEHAGELLVAVRNALKNFPDPTP